jgi:hypothetical protein
MREPGFSKRGRSHGRVPVEEAVLNACAARVYGLNAADAVDTSSSTASSASADDMRDMLLSWFGSPWQGLPDAL